MASPKDRGEGDAGLGPADRDVPDVPPVEPPPLDGLGLGDFPVDLTSTLHCARRAQAGEADAWVELDVKLRPWLLDKLSGRRLPASHDVQDVVQEVLLYVHEHFPQFAAAPGASLRGWVLRIAESKVVDMWRRGSAKKRGGGRERNTAELTDTSLFGQIADDRLQRQSAVARCGEIRARMAKVAESLSAKHREVLELRETEGLPFAEIAERMGYKKEVTVRSLYMRAKLCRAELMREFDED